MLKSDVKLNKFQFSPLSAYIDDTDETTEENLASKESDVDFDVEETIVLPDTDQVRILFS